MVREPLLASQVFQDEEIQCIPPQSVINQAVYEDIEDPFLSVCRDSSSSYNRYNIQDLTRSTSAPAVPIMEDLRNIDQTVEVKSKYESHSIVKQAIFLLIIYLLFGVTVCIFNKENFSGIETHPVVDAIYFSIVTLCTVGYGDIAPLTPATKQWFFGKKLHFRTRVKVGLTLGVVILCIGMGAAVLHFVEKFDVLDSIYLSVMSVTTVGSYGGKAFNTIQGRLFASLWLLVSTLSVARASLYLAELRVDKRHRSMEKWILHRQMTVEDLVAADIDNKGSISATSNRSFYYYIFHIIAASIASLQASLSEGG
ncbi:hypothetical protein C5167_018578 [Papaver somniferum]|uniref:Potassium channel domain-containing protein n=1 Tax=Papaver somniferum TaxID=3469 RepID=A0A4Y7IN93_PAPSO|nr:hypothetical protein C5167_018578 [Papaver somniferum]